MAAQKLFKSSSINSFVFIFSILLTSFFIIGGCNDNNNGGGDFGGAPPGTSTCVSMSSPCRSVVVNSDMTVASCVLFSDTCSVDLMDVVSQVGNGVTADTTMWIGAWGGHGGAVDKAKGGGTGGYAQTTTSISDLMGMNNGSSEIFPLVITSTSSPPPNSR